MKHPDDSIFLYHVFEACQNIITMMASTTFEDLLISQEKQSAVLWNFHVMGEATKNLSDNTLKKYSQIEWSSMARFRDKIVHHYFGIDFDVVWSVAKNKLPELVAELNCIPELVVTLQKMKVEKLNSQLTILTGHTTLAEQEKELRRQVQILFQERCFQLESSSAKWENMTIPELVDLLLSVPEKERRKFISPREQHRAPEQQEPSHGIDL